jgi:histone deacetylase 1/2
MERELGQLIELDCWDVLWKTQLPEGANVLPSTWAFRVKRKPSGEFLKFKARFCARGDKQIEGIDYTDKYAPVVSWRSVRMMLCLAASQGLHTRQVDFSNAFVQADLREDVYISLPPGYGPPNTDPRTLVLKLKKSLYGLVQAPLYWSDHLTAALARRGIKPISGQDPCLFFGKGVICLSYVDDVLFFSKSKGKIDNLISSLKDEFKLTEEDSGDAFDFLGVSIKRHHDTGEVELTQTGLINKVLAATGMSECNAKSTPAASTPLGTDKNGAPCQEEWDYASVVGMLMYLCSNSRPDIQYAVHQCSRFTHCPRKSHEQGVLRICRYLKGTKERGLRFKPIQKLILDCYVDADFAGLWNVENSHDPISVKSRTGYVLTLGGCPLVWASKLQELVSLSTVEAEYIALSQSMRELLPLRCLLLSVCECLDLKPEETANTHSTVFEDNNGALSLASSPKITPRTKHIAVKYHFFRSHCGPTKDVRIVKIESKEQKADIFTKGLAEQPFQHIRKLLMGW